MKTDIQNPGFYLGLNTDFWNRKEMLNYLDHLANPGYLVNFTSYSVRLQDLSTSQELKLQKRIGLRGDL